MWLRFRNEGHNLDQVSTILVREDTRETTLKLVYEKDSHTLIRGSWEYCQAALDMIMRAIELGLDMYELKIENIGKS